MFTQREFLFIEDLLHFEELHARKAKACAQQARDPEIARLFSSAAQRHVQHLQALLEQVQRGQQQAQPPVSYQAPWAGQQQPVAAGHPSGWSIH